MRVHEIITEDAGQYYATNDVVAWRQLTPQQQAEWTQRQQQLNSRVQQIYTRLQTAMTPQDRARLRAITVSVPLHGDSKYARADWQQSSITIDVGAFWDLSDSCLAYTLGHEIGHMVYYSKNAHRPGFWDQKVTAQQNRREELDADTYGAVLAYRLGYDHREAFAFFTREIQAEPASPRSHYPSVAQRRAAQSQAIQRVQKEVQADPPPASSSLPELPLEPAAREDMLHAMAGIQNLNQLLAQDPQIALAVFPDPKTSDTRLA